MEKEIATQIEKLLKSEFYSPYKLAKIESILRGKTIPPQKLYGYCKAGYLAFSLNNLEKMQISKENARIYLQKQIKN